MGGGLTPCTVTISEDGSISSAGVFLNADIYYWDGEKIQEEYLNPIIFPFTFQAYVNSGFIIYGLNNSWRGIYDNNGAEVQRTTVDGDQVTTTFYVVPTSQNYSLSLYYEE